MKQSNRYDNITDGWTFPQLMLYMDMQLRQNLTSWTIEGEDALVVCMSACVESIISQRGKTWKLKALLIYHFQNTFLFVFVLIFSLFLFYWLLLPFCSIHDMFVQKGRLMKLCDGDYTIKKKK